MKWMNSWNQDSFPSSRSVRTYIHEGWEFLQLHRGRESFVTFQTQKLLEKLPEPVSGFLEEHVDERVRNAIPAWNPLFLVWQNFRIILAEYRGKLIFCEYVNFMNMYTKFPLFSPPFSSLPPILRIISLSRSRKRARPEKDLRKKIWVVWKLKIKNFWFKNFSQRPIDFCTFASKRERTRGGRSRWGLIPRKEERAKIQKEKEQEKGEREILQEF